MTHVHEELIERARAIAVKHAASLPATSVHLHQLCDALETSLAENAKLRERLTLTEAVCEAVRITPILHDDDCLTETDDHAPDYACTCGVFTIESRLKAWRQAAEET